MCAATILLKAVLLVSLNRSHQNLEVYHNMRIEIKAKTKYCVLMKNCCFSEINKRNCCLEEQKMVNMQYL